MKDLVIILGAGASAGAVDPGNTSGHSYAPPITKEVFHTRFDGISGKYPNIKALSTGLTSELENGYSLESYLKSKLGSLASYNSLTFHRRSQLNQLPVYLQNLFLDISQTFNLSTLYPRFIDELLDRDIRVTFITLNYDLLLDYAIEVSTGKKFSNFKSYIEGQDKWIELKLHGSVDWYRKIKNYSQDGVEFESYLSIIGTLNVLNDLDEELVFLRNGVKNGFYENLPYYPALAIPNSDYNPIFVDPSYKELLVNRLNECTNYLLIGFSAYDEDLLTILNSHVRKVHKLLIVAKGGADSIYGRLIKKAPIFTRDDRSTCIYDSGFSNFLKINGDFKNFLSSIV